MPYLPTEHRRYPLAALLHGAGKYVKRISKAQLYRIRRSTSHASISFRPGRRAWGIDPPLVAVTTILAGALRYSYRGTSMLKNPFEVALYQLLFWQVNDARRP
jgi:hypothetical protein